MIQNSFRQLLMSPKIMAPLSNLSLTFGGKMPFHFVGPIMALFRTTCCFLLLKCFSRIFKSEITFTSLKSSLQKVQFHSLTQSIFN